MPTAISAAAAIAEWRAGLGLGGRPESASMTGRRATVRPGHQAATVAPTIARSDGHRDQSPRKAEPVDAMVDRGLECRGEHDPEREARDRPDECGDRPDDGAVGRAARDGGASAVAPTAASMPSWRSRRCATTAKPAAATSEARRRKTVATENIANVSAVPLTSFPRTIEPVKAERERSPRDSVEGVARTGASRRLARRPGPGVADEGETRANSSLSLLGFSTMPTTVRRWPSSARVEPSSSRRDSATPSVTATWPGPTG